ncbi:MAG: transposase [Desulfobacter sp.]|nr:MAG: transposase [Desulfobacter sp.]
MKHTRKGRKRKVFKQGSAHISFTGKSVAANAGMALVSRVFDKFHIPELLEGVTADLDQDKRHPTHELLQQLIVLRLMGGEAIQDVRLLAEPALIGMFQWKDIVHPTTYGRRLKTMTWRHNLNLEKISTGLSYRVAKPGKLFITVDSSVCTVHGQKIEGADTGYNPHKPGRNSYHPLIAVDIGSRSVIDGYLRPGSCASNDGLDGFVRKIVSEADRPAKDIIFRFDKGLTSGSILDTIEELGAGYVAKAKLSSTIMGRISKIKNWRSIGNGHFAANFHCKLSGWSRSRRFAAIERNLPPANVAVRSRQLWIKIKRDHPMRLIFYQAMRALA